MLGSRRMLYIYSRRSHKMKKHTRVVSCEGKGDGSHSGEWRGGGVLSGEGTGKATAVTRAGSENYKTVAMQKQLPLAGLDSMRTARTQKTTLVLTINNNNNIIQRLAPEGIIIIHKVCIMFYV